MELPEVNYSEANILPEKKKFSVGRLIKRLVLSLILGTLTLLIGAAALVYFYEDEVKQMIIAELNKHLQSEIKVQPENIDLTIIRTFPSCALDFKQVTAMEAWKKDKKDTLFYTDRISLVFNIKDIFNKNYTIQQIRIGQGFMNARVDKTGLENYIIWKTNEGENQEAQVKFALQKITLEKFKITYRNQKNKIKIQSRVNQMEFSGRFGEESYALKSNGKAYVELFQTNKIKYIENKNLSFDVTVNVKNKQYHFDEAEIKLNDMYFQSAGNLVYQDSLESINLSYKGKNLDISSVLSLLPEKFQNNISDYSSDGMFYAKGTLKYNSGQPIETEADFGIQNATITYNPQSTKLSHVNLVGKFELKPNRSLLSMKNIEADLGNNTFKGDCEIIHFEDPYITIHADVNTSLLDWMKFYPIDTVEELSGNLLMNAHIEGLISEMKRSAYSPTIKANGKVNVQNLKVKFKSSEKELNVPEAELVLNNRSLNVYQLRLLKGSSDVTLVGEMPEFLNYLFDKSAPLMINASLNSEKMELEDFLFSGSSSSSGEVSIPQNLQFNLDATVKNLSFSKFKANDIKGTFLIKDQKVLAKNITLQAMDGNATINAFADASGEMIKISVESDLKSINIQKLFYQFNNFGQTTLEDKHLKGFATANIDFSGKWDKHLVADLNSINATSSLLIERGELIGFKPLESLAKYIEVKELQHIKFSTLQSAVEIKNKTITIPKTSIKSSAINIELYGKHTFDNMIDYHIQLLLSELLAKKSRANKELDDELSVVENDPENRRSVFILMTGPIDNPTIKYDKKGMQEKIKDDIKQEKQNLKQILKEEFGLFKKDSTLIKKDSKASDQKFKLEPAEDNKKQKPTLQPKKKDEDEDF